jgi:alpha-N-arabinofuranosidase
MKTSTIHLHTGFLIGVVGPRLFGGFLEHMGRAVYQGVYEPGSIFADENGFRKDVLEALEGLQMTVMRYPGGNFASGYHWMDGIGPQELRPKVRELAWQSIEPNQFGTEEFMALCQRMNWSPMLTVNLGTGSPEEARNWVEYCNSSAGTRYADQRVANGSQEPHHVKLWCLGNEMDGEWQLGHVPAEQYAIRAQQAANMMHNTDPSIELVACGSCSPNQTTYMDWDRQVLDYLGDLADYISLHRYVGNPQDDPPDYLAVTNSIDRQIEEMDAVCRFIQARRRSAKRAYLCFDEWNIWYKAASVEDMNGHGQFAPHLIEEVYNLEDALVTAGFLNSFIRHADVVKIANLAQIVNVIAPILTRNNAMLLQSIYYPFEMYAKRRQGKALYSVVEGPGYESKNNGSIKYIDTSAILKNNQLKVFITNRDLQDPAQVCIQPADRAITVLENGELLTGPSPKAVNSYEQPEVVRSQTFGEVRIKAGQVMVELPPMSVAAFTFRLE